MTYFHINLDPREKEGKGGWGHFFSRQFLYLWLYWSFFLILWVLFCFPEWAFKDTSSGSNVGVHSSVRTPKGGATSGLWVQAIGHLFDEGGGGGDFVFFCLYSFI